MDKLKIILENGIEKEVDCIFFLYNLKYYFIYTEKESDENGYIIFYLVEVGKEIKNTMDGPLDTGYMVGVEVIDSNLMHHVITTIVEDKKNNTENAEINYLPLSMISTLKIVSKKTFRLMRNIAESNFNLSFSDKTELTNENNSYNTDIYRNSNDIITNSSVNELPQTATNLDQVLTSQENDSEAVENISQINSSSDDSTNQYQTQNEVIIDYRTRFFEEQEKNKNLTLKIEELTKKLEEIKKVIE